MTDKKYLKWYNKVGYGSGDIAGNVVYALLSSFVMIYLTDTVGLNAGIVGTLIAVSKIFDGISDIFFGALIDKTKTKMGKARPWMLYGYFGCAICLIAIFCIPTDMGQIAQYAWFFITYTLLNAGFYTANNIAYSALTALITRNNHERVQMGSIRFMFAFGTSMLIQVITVDIVNNLGGGADAWRTVAIVYAIIGVISNTISVFSVKEFSQKEIAKEETEKEEKYGLIDAFKLLVHNKYFLMICGAYLLMQIYSATLGMGIYFMKYVLGDEEIFGVFAWAINIPMIAGLLLTPILVKKTGSMQKVNFWGYVISDILGIFLIIFAMQKNLPMMLLFMFLKGTFAGTMSGTLNALIAEISGYTYRTKGVHIDGMMFSCSSLGVKVGGGIGTAAVGWLLHAAGYAGKAATQTAAATNMIFSMYITIPVILGVVITILLGLMKVEKENKRIDMERAEKAD